MTDNHQVVLRVAEPLPFRTRLDLHSGYALGAGLFGFFEGFEARHGRELDRRSIARHIAVVPQETELAFEYRAIEIVLMVALALTALVNPGPGGFSFAPLNPGNFGLASNLFLGIVFSIFAFSGQALQVAASA